MSSATQQAGPTVEPAAASTDRAWQDVPARWPDPRPRLRAWAGRPHAVLGAGITLLVLLHVALRGWVLSGASFFEDDYLYLADAQQGLTVDYLAQDYNGHLQGGQFLLTWVLSRVAPLSYLVAGAGILALSTLAVALFARLLLLVCGHRRGVLLPLAVYALSPIASNATSWWAAGLQAVPMQVALILAADAHVRHTWTGRRRWWFAAVASFAVGLLFWEKALVVLPLLVGLTVLVLRPAGSQGFLRQLRPQATLLLAYVALALAYLGLYLGLTTSTGERAGLSTALDAIRISALDTFTIGLAGGPWRVEGELPVALFAPPYAPMLALVLLAALAVVAGTVWRQGIYAVRVWLLLLGYLAVDTVLLAATRLDFIGAELARDPRYVTDAVPVAALCLALALLPRRAPARPAPVVLREPGARFVVLALVLLGYLASALLTTGALARQAATYSAADYLSTLRASLDADPDAALVDGPVPRSAMSGLLFERAVVSTVTTAMGQSRDYLRASENPLIADEQGLLRPVDLVFPVVSDAGPAPGCGWAADGPDGVTVPLPRAEGGVVRFPYLLGTSGRAVVEAAGQRYEVVLLEGLHDLYVPLPPGQRTSTVRVSGLPPGQVACLGPVSVGGATPRP